MTVRILVAAVATLALAGCGADENTTPETISVTLPLTDSSTTTQAQTSGAAESDIDESDVEAAPSAAPPTLEAEAPPEDVTLAAAVPERAFPVIWVRAGHEVEMRTEPGGGQLVARVGRKTDFGSPSVFGVVDQKGSWVAVPTPKLPNGTPGWIRLDPSAIEAGWTKYSVVVDLSERQAQLRLADRPEMTFPVTIGAPESATPTGRFAVTDTFTKLNSSAYGCCAVALSATQPNLPSGWLGGNRIAIHGTYGPLGIAASHGCVRAADPEVAALIKRIPLGTPVFIRS